MKKILFWFFIFNTFYLYSLQWPVDDKAVTANFGEKRNDHYHSGIDIGGGAQDVVSVSEGRVIYYHEEQSVFSDIPSGLGSFIVIEHERALRTSYAHLEKNSILRDRETVDKGEKIGVIGDTGASNGKHLHFEVVDGELNQIINPLKLLPGNPDDVKPVIRNIYIRNADSGKKLLPSRENLKTGTYSLLAQIYDISQHVEYFCPTAPYMVSVFLNGEEVRKITYDSLVKENGRIVLSSNSSTLEDFYDKEEDWVINIGEINLKPGTIRLELSVRDFAGNETIRDRLLTVYK